MSQSNRRLIPLHSPPALTVESDLPDRTPFPIACLPSPLRDQVEHAARSTSAPVSLCGANGLGVAAACIGAGLAVRSGPDRETSGNLFILAFAESGTGKGQAFRAMAGPWLAENAARMKRWREEERPKLSADLELARTDADKAKRKRRDARTAEEGEQARRELEEATQRVELAAHAVEAEPSLNIGQATAEAIGVALAHSPGEAGAIFSAEGRDIVDNLLGRYSKTGKGSDEAIFLQAYSGDYTTIRRLSRPAITLNRPVLTLCASVQPDIWHRLASDERMIESGLLPRCLAFDSNASPCRPSAHVIPAEVRAAWAARVLDLLRFHDAPEPRAVVVPSADALAYLNTLEDEAADKRESGGVWRDVAPFAARLAENAWRLALVLHAMEHGAEAARFTLSLATAEAAERLARWFFAETLALLAPLRSARLRNRLEQLTEIFRLRGPDVRELTERDLANRHGFSAEQVAVLAKEFPQRIRLNTSRPAGPHGGRPSRLVQLAPFATPAA